MRTQHACGARFEREAIVKSKKEWKKVSYFRSIVVIAAADDDVRVTNAVNNITKKTRLRHTHTYTYNADDIFLCLNSHSVSSQMEDYSSDTLDADEHCCNG